jgi:hypothetical protein
MLSKSDSELLCRVENGTLMDQLMEQFRLPGC